MSAFSPHPRIQRTFSILLFVLFLAGIWAPLLAMLVGGKPDTGTDAVENRARVALPELERTWESLRTFPDRFEVYADNQFGLRDILIRWHGQFCTTVWNMSSSPKVRLGREGWLYFDGDESIDDASPIDDYTGLRALTTAQLEALRYVYQDQSDYLRALGMKYMLVLVPTKPFVYPEYLPPNVIRARDISWRAQLVDYLRENTDVDVLDLGPTLLAAREEDPVFFRTDTHWNPVGGLRATTGIIQALKPWFPQLEPRPDSIYLRNPRAIKQGDLGRMMNLGDRFEETYVDLTPGPEARGSNRLLSESEYAAIAGGNGDPTYPTAQVYRDSYAEYLYPFLSEYFSEVGYEWGQKGTQMTGIEQGHPDLVLQISCDRALSGTMAVARRMQEQASRLRFERARPVAAHTPETGFDALRVSRKAQSSVTGDGLAVTSPEGHATLTLPLALDGSTELPVLRIDIRPEKPGLLNITSPTRPVHRGKRPPEVGLGRFRLESGRNIFHLTLTHPEIRDHITLDFGPDPGGHLVYAIELRSLPRYGDGN